MKCLAIASRASSSCFPRTSSEARMPSAGANSSAANAPATCSSWPRAADRTKRCCSGRVKARPRALACPKRLAITPRRRLSSTRPQRSLVTVTTPCIPFDGALTSPSLTQGEVSNCSVLSTPTSRLTWRAMAYPIVHGLSSFAVLAKASERDDSALYRGRSVSAALAEARAATDIARRVHSAAPARAATSALSKKSSATSTGRSAATRITSSAVCSLIEYGSRPSRATVRQKSRSS